MNYLPTTPTPELLLVDGVLVRSDDIAREVSVLNRGLLFGDGLFESMRTQDSRILCWRLHKARMDLGMSALGLQWRAEHHERLLPESLTELVHRTLADVPARIRLTVWRDGGGRYLPHSNHARWLATCEPLEAPAFPRHAPQRLIWAPDFRLQSLPNSGYKSLSASIYVQAARLSHEAKVDDVLLADSVGNVAETGRANIFFLSGSKLYTPPLSTGCVAGIVRQAVLQGAVTLGLNVIEAPITYWQLSRFSAGFTTNILDGIRPIASVIDGATELRFGPHPAIEALREWLQSFVLQS